MAKPPKRRSISLALQGGGSHGAYTWGVLDRLDRRLGLRVHHVAVIVGGDEEPLGSD